MQISIEIKVSVTDSENFRLQFLLIFFFVINIDYRTLTVINILRCLKYGRKLFRKVEFSYSLSVFSHLWKAYEICM